MIDCREHNFYRSRAEGECPMCEVKRLRTLVDQMVQTLEECEEFFDQRADADYDGERVMPNNEMVFLALVRESIAKAGAR